MIFRIPKGKHRARPLRFGLWWRHISFCWQVTFTASCRYDLANANQMDINKLVGIGYLPGHHTNSARFGWRYWVGKDEIELLAYCYVNGDRVIKHIGYLKIDVPYNIELYASLWVYHFMLNDERNSAVGDATVLHDNKRKLQYRLGTYFGGDETLGHDVIIELNKI